jgi:hypothetical protein
MYSLGEMDHVKTYKEDYENKNIRDWLAGAPVAHEKEAPLMPYSEG